MGQSYSMKKVKELEKLSFSWSEYVIKNQQKTPTALGCEAFALWT